MLLAFFLYTFLLLYIYICVEHNSKLLFGSSNTIQEVTNNNKIWRWPLFLAVIPLIIIIGFRYNVGVDYLGYFRDYLGLGRYKELRWQKIERYEVGYQSLMRVLIYFKMSAWALFTIIGILIWYFFIQSFKVLPHLLKWGFFFAFTTGFFFATNNGMRQSIALVIFFYALKYIEEKSLIKYTIYILFAASFHTSIFLLYPFYFFVNKISFTKRKWLLIYSLTYIIGNKIDIRDLIIFGLDFFPKYKHYTDMFLEDFSNPASAGLGNLYMFGVSFLIILFSRELLEKIPKLKIYYNFFFIGAVLFNFFWKYDILGRITYLFIWFEIFCLAAFVYYFGKSKKSWIVYLLIATQLIMFFYKIYKGENLCAPFQFLSRDLIAIPPRG